MAGGLSCVVANINGLNGDAKRRTVFRRLHEEKPAVAVFCETHCEGDDCAREWEQEGAGPGRPWLGHAAWHHGTRQSRGVAMFIDPQYVAGEVTVDHRDGTGRILVVGFRDRVGQQWQVMGVYAPAEPSQRPAFFSGAFAQACAARDPAARLLVAGDFNCAMAVADVQQVAGAVAGHNSRLVGSAQLQQAMADATLDDAWRRLHPEAREFTRITMSVQGPSAGRTTMWLVDQGLAAEGWGLRCQHRPGHMPGDHHAVTLELSPPTQPHWGSGYWKLPLYLLSMPEYVAEAKQCIRDELERVPEGARSAAATWEAIKAVIMHHATAFGYRRAARERLQRRQLQQRVTRAEAARAAQPHSVAAAHGLQQAVQRLQQYEEQRGDRESRALGALWAAYGEQGTGWFHRLGKQAPDQFPILQVRDPAGGPPACLSTAEGALRAGSLLADYFDGDQPEGLFHPRQVSQPAQEVLLDSIDRVLSDSAARACLGPLEDGRLTEACVAQVLADAPPGKSPGHDGLPYEFYRAFWAEVKGPMVAAFNEAFLSEGQQPQFQGNALMGVIVLLYKQGGKPREDPDSYRPITLLNCDVKLVAKVMSRRFGVPLDSVVDATQTAFVPGRYIGDNVLYHLEAVEYFTAAQQPACMVGLDFAKAYDRVDRGWLGRCMVALGVPAAAIRWVDLLLAGTRAMVLYNGHLSRAFAIRAGCAQGSPLSPLLYVVAAQPLAARCRQLVRQGMVSPVVLPGGGQAPPTHQHADDTTLHARTVEDAGVMLAEAVQPFCAASGAELSMPKSWGLTLGTHQLLVGPHAATGIPFVAPGEAVRHLGVPLVVGDAGEAVKAVFARKLQAMRLKVLRWGKFKLTYVGRVHVAKQALASVLSYHATFLPVPEDVMQQMMRVIQGYVVKERIVEQADGSIWGRPCAAVAALPKGMGGMGMVDLPAFVQALQGKVIAMLLHPKAAPWKALMRWALGAGFPEQGLRVVLHRPRVSQRPESVSSRHMAALRAFWGLPVVRQVPHAQMSGYQVRVEGLVANPSVCRADGTAFPSANALPDAARGRGSLGGIPAEVWHEMVLPGPWRERLAHVEVSEWEVSSDGRRARRLQGGVWEGYEVFESGQVVPVQQPPLAAGGAQGWHAACVVAVPVKCPHAPPCFYVVGRWSAVQVDPSVWAVGQCSLLGYKVREATAALIMLGAKAVPGWVHGRGVRPKLWGLPGPEAPGGLGGASLDGAVQLLDAQQRARFQEAQQAPGNSRGTIRVRSADQGGSLYLASWMLPSPERDPVRQRVEAHQAAVTQLRELQQQAPGQGQVMGPVVDDTVWPVAAPQAWGRAWARVHHRRVPRATQVFGWRLLHGALMCGGVRVPMVRLVQELQRCACFAPCCQYVDPKPLETLHHMYTQCAVGKGALKWLAGLWGLIDPGGAPIPESARVWLADDESVWKPSQGLAALWALLRLTMLKCVWSVRCVARRGPQEAFTRSAVVGAFVREVRGLIHQDWATVEGDVRTMAGVPPSWFRGRDPTTTLAQFQEAWCAGGVLASVSLAAPQPSPRYALTVHLTVRSVPGQYVVDDA